MNIIEQIASTHLGKAGDGSVVKPYVTPDAVDASLLVGIPRYLNRQQYNIVNGEVGSVGMDVWNAYEVSFLLSNGFPVSCYVRIVYSATSANIVESKSIKLYLNSFNMNRFDTLSVAEAVQQVKAKIESDLAPVLGTRPFVGVMLAQDTHTLATVPADWVAIEDSFDHTQYKFNTVTETPGLLVASDNTTLRIRTSLLRSNCRVTSQPDWGDVYIAMDASKTPTIPSLAQYIVSMRKENHFHEEICECIYKRLSDLYSPVDLFVACLYTRRGGIDINPVRYSSPGYFQQYFPDFLQTDVIYKTTRQ